MGSQNKTQVTEEKEYYSNVEREFVRLAPFYDFIVAGAARMRQTVVDIAGAKPGANVLDIATGTGKQAMAFARHGYKVNAVDLSEAMLRIARRKNRYPDIKFDIADATRLPFDDKSFDVVTISFGLHEMVRSVREKALAEMARVSRPGGMILIVDWGLPKNRVARFFANNLIRSFERYFAEFARYDLRGQLLKLGIGTTEEIPLLGGGVVRLLKGTKY